MGVLIPVHRVGRIRLTIVLLSHCSIAILLVYLRQRDNHYPILTYHLKPFVP